MLGAGSASAAAIDKEQLVSALLAAFATFAVFGAAVVGFLSAGGVIQTVGSWWAQHGKAEAVVQRKAKEVRTGLKWARRRSLAVVVLTGAVVVAAVAASILGLAFSFVWLHGYARGSVAHLNGLYAWIIVLFWFEVGALCVATLIALVAAAFSAVNASRSADRSGDLDDAITSAATELLQPTPGGMADGKVAG